MPVINKLRSASTIRNPLRDAYSDAWRHADGHAPDESSLLHSAGRAGRAPPAHRVHWRGTGSGCRFRPGAAPSAPPAARVGHLLPRPAKKGHDEDLVPRTRRGVRAPSALSSQPAGMGGAWWVGIYVLVRFGFTARIPSPSSRSTWEFVLDGDLAYVSSSQERREQSPAPSSGS